MEVVRPVRRNVLLSPGPSTTTDTVKYAQVVPDICPREKEFVGIMEQVRGELLKVVHADPSRYAAVLFTGSGTMIQDVLVNSLVPAGKKICIVNNGAYSTRMAEITTCYGIPCVNLEFPWTRLPDMGLVRRALEQDRDVAVVATTHHETGTGILNPVREIGRVAHDHGCVFVADTISTYGLLPINLEEENIDFCMSSAQKGLCAMTGLSWAIGKTEEIVRSRTYPTRSYYCNLFMQYDYFERVGEMHFTPPVQLFYALRQAIKEYWQEGEEARYQRFLTCWEQIHEGLKEMGLECAVAREIQAPLVVTVKAPEDNRFDFDILHDYCYERGFTIYPGKMFGTATFRLCNLGWVTVGEIEEFFGIAKEAFRKMGFGIPIK